MQGTEKQVAWATDLKAIAETAGLLDAKYLPLNAYDEPMINFDDLTAAWWIDNKVVFYDARKNGVSARVEKNLRAALWSAFDNMTSWEAAADYKGRRPDRRYVA